MRISTRNVDEDARLLPFFVETDHDAALLRDELAKLKTLSQIREERRVEHNTEEILRVSEGVSNY